MHSGEWPGTLLCERCAEYLPEDYVLPVAPSAWVVAPRLLCERCVREQNAEFMKEPTS